MAYIHIIRIIETPIFTRRLKDILSEENYRELQNHLVASPLSGKVIPGSGGLRKLRWSIPGQGKRGGSQVIYYWFANEEIILTLLIYPKSTQDNLTQKQLKILSRLLEDEFNGR